jgi:hypothetical protein
VTGGSEIYGSDFIKPDISRTIRSTPTAQIESPKRYFHGQFLALDQMINDPGMSPSSHPHTTAVTASPGGAFAGQKQSQPMVTNSPTLYGATQGEDRNKLYGCLPYPESLVAVVVRSFAAEDAAPPHLCSTPSIAAGHRSSSSSAGSKRRRASEARGCWREFPRASDLS